MKTKKRIFFTVILLCMLISMCISTGAEESPSVQVNFTMTAQPRHIFEMTAEEVKTFFEKEDRKVIFNSNTTTQDVGMMIIDGLYKLRDISILTFKITDFATFIQENPNDDLQKMMDDIFTSVIKSIQKKQISTCIYTYACDMKAETENGSISDVYINIAFYFGDNISELDSVISDFVQPAIKEWAEYSDIEKLLMLNTFILNGQFSYDVEEHIRKSTVDFINDKKGVCEDYAGLTALFLDEMGFENIIMTGYVRNESGEKTSHSWNMVKIEDQWYHLDILWNGPIDSEGNHTKIQTDYFLKSTKTFFKDHFLDSGFSEYTRLAVSDYTLSDDEKNFNPGQSSELTEKETALRQLKELLDEGYNILSNHAEEFSEETIKNLSSVYNDSRDIYINEASSAEEIKTATSMLQTIMSSMTKAESVEKESLFSALGSAYEMLFYTNVSVLYPTDSLKELESVYNSAVEVYTDNNSTQTQVNNAKWRLWSKINEIKALLNPTTDPDDSQTQEEITHPNQDENNNTTDNTQDNQGSENSEKIENNENTGNEENQGDSQGHPNTDTPSPDLNNKQQNPISDNKQDSIYTDILIYIILAIAAASGIVFFIVDGVKSRKQAELKDNEISTKTDSELKTDPENSQTKEVSDCDKETDKNNEKKR